MICCHLQVGFDISHYKGKFLFPHLTMQYFSLRKMASFSRDDALFQAQLCKAESLFLGEK
jgi:hypothetical protein